MKSIIEPLGISFITFECISYIGDINNNKAKPGSYVDVLLFLSLFPKLVSGPIVLWRDFEPQINERKGDVIKGMNRIIIGYAEKVIIADTLGYQIQLINEQIPLGVDTPTMWLRAIFYFFQIYFDFSGYSQIAIGLCEIFGFNIKDNFDYPYTSKSITEFWRRWHISLGAWFREYVYIPLGGNRSGNVYLHIFIVFLLTGLWHGIGWTFLIWGIMQGLFVMLEKIVMKKKWYQKTPNIIKSLVTIIIIFFSWILFSATNLNEAINTYKSLFTLNKDIVNFTWLYFLSNKTIIVLVIAILASFGVFKKLKHVELWLNDSKIGFTIKQISLLSLLVIDIMFIVSSTYSPFLYFQF